MEQQNQQPIQQKTENKPPIKTNWKFLAIIVFLALLIAGVTWRQVQKVKQDYSELPNISQEKRLPMSLSCSPENSAKARAEQLTGIEPVLELKTKDTDFVLSPSGQYLAVRIESNSLMQIYDITTNPPRNIEIPDAGQISAAFSNDEKTVWFGTKTGNAVQVNLQTKKIEKSIPIFNGRSLDEIVILDDGRYLGWHSPPTQILSVWPPPLEYKGSSAGVFGIKTDKQLKVWENADYHGVGPGTPTKNISFGSHGTRFLTYTKGGLVIWNASTDVLQTMLGVYPMHNSPGHVYVDGKVYYSSGDDIVVSDVAFWDPFGSKAVDESGTLESKLQGGHFNDVYLSPSGRLLVAQPELGGDERLHLYDLSLKKRINVIGEGNKNNFLGWDRSFELIFTTGEKGVDVWDPQSGEDLGKINILTNQKLKKIEASADGCFLVASGWTSQREDKPARYHLTVFQILEDVGKQLPDKSIDTSSWQTYRNDEFGFEFRYPADRELGYLSVEGAYLGSLSAIEARNTNTLIVGSKDGVHIIDILADVNNVSIHREPAEVTLNGVSYKKYEMVGVSNATVYVTTHDDKQYWIEVQSSNLASQILSTFRFVEKY